MKSYEERLPMIDEAIDKLGKDSLGEDGHVLCKANLSNNACRFGSLKWIDFSNPCGYEHIYWTVVGTADELERRVKEREAMKTKNDWYEKGEFPPVGEVVKIDVDYILTNGNTTFEVKSGDKVRVVQNVDSGYGKVCLISIKKDSFHATIVKEMLSPLRTEEDELFGKAMET